MTEKIQKQVRLFASGKGQSDTHAVEIEDRETGEIIKNTHALAGKPYLPITAVEIAQLAVTPAAEPKNRAPWFIPSTYIEHDARVHAIQKERGEYHILPIDVDSGNHSIDDVDAALKAVIGEASSLLYSTSSATPDNRKWRGLVFLSEPVPGEDYKDTQEALFALLRGHGITCDMALARTGQLVFLPNVPPEKRHADGRPIFYEHRLNRHRGLLLTEDHPIIVQREKMRADVRAAVEEQQKRRSLPVRGEDRSGEPITEFNKNHSIEEMLERYGYKRLGQSNDWQSPNQTSGSYATRVFDGRVWVSLSGSDMAAGLGVQREHCCCGDAFDLFKHYEHGGDERAAVRAYGRVINPSQNVVPFNSLKHDFGDPVVTDSSEPQPPVEVKPKLPPVSDDKLTDWAFLSGDNEFYNRKTGEAMGVSAFNLAKLPITESVEVGTDKHGDPIYKRLSPSKTLIEYKNGVVAHSTMYRPDVGDADLITVNGVKYVNSYMPWSTPEADEDWRQNKAWEVCQNHIENILGEDAEVMIQWLAHNVQFPGRKILWAPVLVGVQGDGKTTLSKMLAAAMGVRNVSPVSPEAMFSDFTGWAEGSCVKVLEEIRVFGNNRHVAMDKLKPLITNELVEIVRKGKDGKQVINVTNYIALTNHMDALALDEGDRRWGVFKTRFENRAQMLAELDDAYWAALHGAIDQHPGVIRGWLLNVDLSGFNRVTGPAMSPYKRQMIEDTKSQDQADIEELLEVGWLGVGPDVLATDCLNAALYNLNGGRMNTQRLSKALKLIGWDKQSGVLKWRGKTRKLWVRRGGAAWGADSTEIRRLLDATVEENGSDF